MYDFYFGSPEEIQQNEEKYLLFIKRMLPRWCNSIPDSEFIALHRLLEAQPKDQHGNVLVETGVGASTIVLLHHALKRGSTLYSWDMNGNKGAFLRALAVDTLLTYHQKNLSRHWKFVAYNSHSKQLGLSILAEFKTRVGFAFLDSEHTLDVLLGEVERLMTLLSDGATVAIDDANYAYRHTNISYVNMMRRKLDLPPAPEPENNHVRPFYQEVEEFLKTGWKQVRHIDDTYKKEYREDIYWSYYDSDRASMAKAGMEKMDALEHRFDAWQLIGRKASRK
jgi:hypothetical protein